MLIFDAYLLVDDLYPPARDGAEFRFTYLAGEELTWAILDRAGNAERSSRGAAVKKTNQGDFNFRCGTYQPDPPGSTTRLSSPKSGPLTKHRNLHIFPRAERKCSPSPLCGGGSDFGELSRTGWGASVI
jgi:hypothetical protein